MLTLLPNGHKEIIVFWNMTNVLQVIMIHTRIILDCFPVQSDINSLFGVQFIPVSHLLIFASDWKQKVCQLISQKESENVVE